MLNKQYLYKSFPNINTSTIQDTVKDILTFLGLVTIAELLRV